MGIKRIIAAVVSLGICAVMVGCSDKADSISQGNSQTETSAQSQDGSTVEGDESEAKEGDSSQQEVGTTDYVVDGDFKAFDSLKDTYYGNYSIVFSMESMGTEIENSVTICGEKVYMATVVSGMKSYSVTPGDGNTYTISEATTTYSQAPADDNYIVDNDFLFGATGEYSKAQIDEQTNTVYEYYKLNEQVAGGAGEIAYGFDGETYQIKEIKISYEDMETEYDYTVVSLNEADEQLVQMPDLSAYTKE